MSTILSFIKSKYNNQNMYIATNAVGEFQISFSKIQNISSNKRPSRANVSPPKKSIIISKLYGDNKLYYFGEQPNEVFSTGFFNIHTNYIDHLMGFLLSESFKHQKNMLFTGTTMVGLNNHSFNEIFIKHSKDKSDEISNVLFKIDNIINIITKLKNLTIKLLIK